MQNVGTYQPLEGSNYNNVEDMKMLYFVNHYLEVSVNNDASSCTVL